MSPNFPVDQNRILVKIVRRRGYTDVGTQQVLKGLHERPGADVYGSLEFVPEGT